MNFECFEKGSELVIALNGRLDTTTAPRLEAELKERLDGVEKLVFDFSGLSYISSAGLRVMLSTHKIMSRQGTMSITHVGDVIMEIFEVTGFTEILNIE